MRVVGVLVFIYQLCERSAFNGGFYRDGCVKQQQIFKVSAYGNIPESIFRHRTVCDIFWYNDGGVLLKRDVSALCFQGSVSFKIEHYLAKRMPVHRVSDNAIFRSADEKFHIYTSAAIVAQIYLLCNNTYIGSIAQPNKAAYNDGQKGSVCDEKVYRF